MSNNVTQTLLKSAFGQLVVVEPTPVIQIIGTYGVKSKLAEQSTPGSTTVIEGSLLKATASGADGLATITSSRYLSYNSGQGAASSFTAQFTDGAVGNEQFAGLISATDGFVYGFIDNEYGIGHFHDGIQEIQELTVTTGAAGAENATVTVDGTAYTVPLTAGTPQHNAIEISDSLNSQVVGWDFSSNDDQVVALSVLAFDAGAFAFTSATAVATWSQVAGGTSAIRDFYPQEEWNQDTASWLDYSKLNVYHIQMEYLGAGAIEFYVEDEDGDDWLLVHRIGYTNQHDTPSVTNPSFRVGWGSLNSTATGDFEVSGASASGVIQGKDIITEPSRSLTNSDPAVSAAAQVNILTLRSRRVIDSKENRAEARLLKVSAYTESSKGAVLEVRKNATLSGVDVVYQYVDKESSITEYATDTAIVTGGDLLESSIVTTSGVVIDVEEFGNIFTQGDTVTISMQQNGTPAALGSVSATWVEDL